MSKPLELLSVPLLVAGLAGLLVIRISVASDDGGAAAVVIGLFWLVALGLFLKLVVALSRGEGGWEYILLLVALLAFVVSAIFGKDTVGSTTFIVFLVSMCGLTIVWFKRWRGRSIRDVELH